MSDDELTGKGSTTLDYLKVRHEWLGVMIDDAAKRERELLARVRELEAERDRLRDGHRALIKGLKNSEAAFEQSRNRYEELKAVIWGGALDSCDEMTHEETQQRLLKLLGGGS